VLNAVIHWFTGDCLYFFSALSIRRGDLAISPSPPCLRRAAFPALSLKRSVSQSCGATASAALTTRSVRFFSKDRRD